MCSWDGGTTFKERNILFLFILFILKIQDNLENMPEQLFVDLMLFFKFDPNSQVYNKCVSVCRP